MMYRLYGRCMLYELYGLYGLYRFTRLWDSVCVLYGSTRDIDLATMVGSRYDMHFHTPGYTP